MSRNFAGFSSAVCTFAVLLNGCSDSQSLSAQDPVSGIPVDGEQILVPVNDGSQAGGDLQAPPTVVIPPVDDQQTDSNNGPEGDSNISVGSRRFPLSSALGDIWGVESGHYNVNFTLTDGQFTITPTLIDGVTYNLLTPVRARGIFRADLHSPGDGFSFETYSYAQADANSDALSGVAFFENALVGVDLDNSGDVDEDEKLAVLGGTVEFTGAIPDIELNFSVTLSNGQMAHGHYTGLFDFTQR